VLAEPVIIEEMFYQRPQGLRKRALMFPGPS
jgi:hypothetical protein